MGGGGLPSPLPFFRAETPLEEVVTMRIFHPAHRTAWSARTTGMPVLVVSGEGVLDILSSEKRAGYWVLPDETRYLVHVYRTGSGHRVLYFLAPTDGLPEVGVVRASDGPDELRSICGRLGIGEGVMNVLSEYLWG